MSLISKELKLSQKYTNQCIRATAVSLLDECNFEARHIMPVLGHKSESSIRSYSRRLWEVKQKEISHAPSSACSVENVESSSAAIVLQVKIFLGRNTVPNSSVTMQNFASQSQETVNFNAGLSIFRSKCYHQFLQFQMILYLLSRLCMYVMLCMYLKPFCLSLLMWRLFVILQDRLMSFPS